MNQRLLLALFVFVGLVGVLVACGPAATSAPSVTEATAITQVAEATVTAALAATQAPAATGTALASGTSAPATVAAPTPITEQRVVELEWPSEMRFGESDLIRISLIPTKNGYTVTTEFPEHQVATQEVPVPRPGGYDLAAVARLDGVGFEIAPTGDLMQGLPLDEKVTWRWTITPRAAGQQRLSLNLRLRWTPSPGNTTGAIRETTIYDKGLNVEVRSFFGLTAGQALAVGFVGLVMGSSLSLPLAASLMIRPRRRSLPAFDPNSALVIEKHPAFDLAPDDEALLRVLFRRYARLTLEAEFRSGYSGARTLLALPVRADGRADAHTIAKIGEREAIQREYENYEQFVKDTLPPITARIQETPVTRRGSDRAVLRYTFIGEAGKTPMSLRELLITNPDPSILEKLFSTFGPNWWMQRRAHTFRLAQEYDRLLPVHYVLEPTTERRGKILDGRASPPIVNLKPGDYVTPRRFLFSEPRADGASWTLIGQPGPGQPPLRVRWLSPRPPDSQTAGRVVAMRETLLRELVVGLDRLGLPDPLARLPALLDETVIGTQSTIHGDLNLENVLVGPGGFVWLIDFAQTRDGHPLYDFAHLEADLIAHVLAPQLLASDYLTLLGFVLSPNPQLPITNSQSLTSTRSVQSLLSTLHAITSRCLFNPSQPREYWLALYLACLGALKYANLSPHQRHCLYLTAARLCQFL